MCGFSGPNVDVDLGCEELHKRKHIMNARSCLSLMDWETGHFREIYDGETLDDVYATGEVVMVQYITLVIAGEIE